MTNYHEMLLELLSSDNWFHFHRGFARTGAMSKLESLFFQDLINRAKKAETTKDGFFLCTEDYLAEDWTRNQQTHFLEALKKRGYLKFERRGCPPRRWLYLELEKVTNDWKARELSAGKQGNYQLESKGTIIYEQERMNKNTLLAVPAGGSENGFFSGNGKLPVERKLANHLYEGVIKAGLTITLKRGELQKHLKKSSKGFSALLDIYPQREIEETLEYHLQQIGRTKWWPDARCGESFFEKYDKIRAKISHLNESTKEDPPPCYVKDGVLLYGDPNKDLM